MRILLTGASGQLGGYVLRESRNLGLDMAAWSGAFPGRLFGYPVQPVDLADAEQVTAAFQEARPSIIIHAGALSAVGACHQDPARAWQINAAGSKRLADLAASAGVRLILISTDLVFDGGQGWYREQDSPAPLSVYGQTKLAAERAVLGRRGAVVVRVSLLYGLSLTGRKSFFDQQVTALQQQRPCTLFADEWRTPLALTTAARGLLAIAHSDYEGLLHFGGPERLSRVQIGQRLADRLGANGSLVVSATRASVAAPEPRPCDTSLDSSLFRSRFPEIAWPSWDEALREMMA